MTLLYEKSNLYEKIINDDYSVLYEKITNDGSTAMISIDKR